MLYCTVEGIELDESDPSVLRDAEWGWIHEGPAGRHTLTGTFIDRPPERTTHPPTLEADDA